MASFIPYAPDSAFAEPSVDVTSTATTGSAADTARTATESVSIIFTNDVHSAIDASEGSALGYAGVAAFVEDAEAEHGKDNVTLVDAGDAVQGGLISTVTNGEANIAIMNKVGYDYAVPGNHEFDYGMDQFQLFANTLDAPYISCNFVKTDSGTKLANIGELTITPGAADGQDIDAALASAASYTKTDPDIASYIANINNQYAAEFDEVVGTTDFPLVSTDSADNQIVRYQETNLGDFIADAIRESLDAEVAFINGGGVRSNLDAGNITKADLISTQPFSNNLSLIETSGQSILDALELGASKCPEADGGFLQVSGLTYTINTAIPSSVVVDENETFVRVDGQRRVSNVKINGVDIDPQKTYRVASINYLLFEGGNGMTMFNDATVINRDAMVDNQALVNYLESMPDNKIPATYQDPSGNGRITIVSETPEEGGDTPTDPSDPTTDPSDTPTDPSDPTTDPNAGGSDSDDNAANGQAEGLPQTGDDSLQIIVPLVATNALSGAALMALALLFARKCNTVRKTRQRIL